MRGSSSNRNLRPLDAAALERLALRYVGRYATTRAKLVAYLTRKVGERGWAGDGAPSLEGLADKFATQGYVDDRAFAEARAAAFVRRGYGERRLGDALKAAGIDEDDAAPVRADAREQALAAALVFARRRRIGPFSKERPDSEQRRRLLGAMLRAGHPMELCRRILDAAPGDLPDEEAL